jgi:hypothetical protein
MHSLPAELLPAESCLTFRAGQHWPTALAVLKHGDMFVISSSQVPSSLRA